MILANGMHTHFKTCRIDKGGCGKHHQTTSRRAYLCAECIEARRIARNCMLRQKALDRKSLVGKALKYHIIYLDRKNYNAKKWRSLK